MCVGLVRIAMLVVLAVTAASGAFAQGPFPGSSYITPFPAGDTYRMQVYGDAFAQGLLGGLTDAFTGDARVQLEKRRRALSGITRYDFEGVLKAEAEGRETVHIAVVMLGYNDRYNIRTGQGRIALGSPEWREEYGRRVELFAKALKGRGMAVYWVGLPIMAPPERNEVAQIVNEIVREKAYLNGIKYIDIAVHFADESGNYTAYGPDITGRQRLVREHDGVLFTWSGFRKLAHFVEREIKRDLTQAQTSRTIPLAGSEAEQKRIAARRPRPPGQGGKGSATAVKEGNKGEAKRASTPRPAGADAPSDPKADHGRIVLKTVAAGGREEAVTLELPRPAIPTAVVQLLTRKDTGERASPMGDSLADDVGGGLVVLSSVTPLATGPGALRKAVPGQPYYQVWFKGERLPPRPGRSDDFAWPRAEPDLDTRRSRRERSERRSSDEAAPRG